MTLRANKPEVSEVVAWIQETVQAFADRRASHPAPPEGVTNLRLFTQSEPWVMGWANFKQSRLLAGKPDAGSEILVEDDDRYTYRVTLGAWQTMYDVVDLLNITLHSRKIPYRLVDDLGTDINEKFFQMLLDGEAL